MLKQSILLGALVGLAVPSVAVAQEPPPEAEEAPPAELPPEEATTPVVTEPAPVMRDSEEPPATPARPRLGSYDAPLPRGGGPPPPESAPPTPPDRSGATFEMSMGLGMTHVALEGGLSASFGGLSGLNLGVGGWVSPKTALTLRLAGTSFFEQIEGTEVQFIAGMLGLSMQHMVTNELWIGGGAGIGVLTTDQDNIEPETGLSLDLRMGINIYQSRQNAFHLAVEATPGFYDGVNVTGIGLQLGWQSL
ncbi:MAG TPA: hypothetical protein VNO30_00355 [Kofleriaceae bacterium]|nr:hypothetical protein [Kofleriaceae bacterium]